MYSSVKILLMRDHAFRRNASGARLNRSAGNMSLPAAFLSDIFATYLLNSLNVFTGPLIDSYCGMVRKEKIPLSTRNAVSLTSCLLDLKCSTSMHMQSLWRQK